MLQESGHVEGTLEDPAHGRGEQDRLIAKRHEALSGSASQITNAFLEETTSHTRVFLRRHLLPEADVLPSIRRGTTRIKSVHRRVSPYSSPMVADPPLVSVVVPTRNEAGNIEPLWNRLQAALGITEFEFCLVDDSDDDTPER